jgi:peptide/nickel transport system ATP-binding protein
MTTMDDTLSRSPGEAADNPVLVVEDLRVHYDTASGPAKAVDGVSFSLKAGERLGLIGESGSGKTTMATALMRLTRTPGRIVGGRVMLDGRDILKMSPRELRETRLRDIALMPQGAMSSLNPVMLLREQIIDAIVAHAAPMTRGALETRVAELLVRVGLDPSVAGKYPHELSGGMKQRAAMAITTSLQPKVIVADEPTSALDVVVQRQVMQTLGRLQGGLGAAVVLIGHDMGLIAQFSDTVGVMYAGKIVEIGPVAQIISAPRHPYTKLLIASLPGIEVKQSLTGIPGLPPPLSNLPPGCSFSPRCPFAFDRCAREVPLLQRVMPRQFAACHLYPGHAALPPLPSVTVKQQEFRT